MMGIQFVIIFFFVSFKLSSIKARTCEDTHYPTKDGKCIQCDNCKAGQGVNINCGHNSHGVQTGPGCRRCSDREYSGLGRSMFRLVRRCFLCEDCHKKNKKFLKKCSRTRNAVCGGCLKGYYKDSLGDCYKCSPCCRGGTVEKECIEGGAALACSCSQKSCWHSRNSNCNAKLTTTKPVSLRRTKAESSSKLKTTMKTIQASTLRKYTFRRVSSTLSPSSIKYPTTTSKDLGTTKTSIVTTPERQNKTANILKHESNESISELTENKVKAIFKGSQKPMSTQSPTITVAEKENSTKVFYLARTRPKPNAERVIYEVESNAAHEEKGNYLKILIGFCAVVALAVVALIVALTAFRITAKRRHPPISSDNSSTSEGRNSFRSSTSDPKSLVSSWCEYSSAEAAFQESFKGVSIKDLVNKAEPFLPEKDPNLKEVTKTEGCSYLSLPDAQGETQDQKVCSSQTCSNLPESTPLMTSSEGATNRFDSELERKPFSARCICSYGKDKRCEKLLEDLKSCQKKELYKYLDVENSLRNWKDVAVYFRVEEKDIDIWSTMLLAGQSPTSKLICHLISKRHTVQELVICLEKISRLEIKEHFLLHLRRGCSVCRGS